MNATIRALFDTIIAARIAANPEGEIVTDLRVRLHPADYALIGLESRHHFVGVDAVGAPVTILHMPLVQDGHMPIGAPVVEHVPEAAKGWTR